MGVRALRLHDRIRELCAEAVAREKAARHFLTLTHSLQSASAPPRHYLQRYMTFVTVEPPPNFYENHCKADSDLPESVCSTVKL